jgi:hypothetical protein
MERDSDKSDYIIAEGVLRGFGLEWGDGQEEDICGGDYEGVYV